MKMVMMMSGSFNEIFEKQLEFQKKLLQDKNLPMDSVEWFNYHMVGMIEELGELRKSDKRWKMFRNSHYDVINKVEEISDCFLTLMNLAIFSGLDAELLLESIEHKISVNEKRVMGNDTDS